MFSKSKQVSSSDINMLLKQYELKNFVEVESISKVMIKKYPNFALSWKILGAVLRQTGRLDESLNAFKQAVQVAPDDAEAFFGLANVFQNLGNFDDARKNYLNAISIKQNYPEAMNNLGIALKELGELKESEMSHRDAINLKSDDPGPHNNLGVVLKLLKKYDEAIVSYKNAIRLNPKYIDAHENLGNLYQEIGRYQNAENCYKKLLNIEPFNSAFHNNLGAIQALLNKYEEAINNFKKSISFKNNNVDAHINLAKLFQKIGRLNDSEASYRNAIALMPTHSIAHNNLGVVLKYLGKFDEAISCYQNAININQGSSEAHFNLGLEFYRRDNYKKASEHFKLSNNAKAASYNLRCLYYINKKLFIELYDQLIVAGERNAVLGHYGCLANIKFQANKKNLFCSDPLQYVFEKNLKREYDFSEDFSAPLKAMLEEQKIPIRRQDLLVNGMQTFGNLFELEDNSIKKIKRIILLEVEKYRSTYAKSNEGFIKYWPKDFDIYGWLIKMKSEGELHPHMHDTGWITGSIYINIPPKLNLNSGNIVVSIDDREFPLEGQDVQKKSIDVVTGSMCLFPASLLHYTIPFSSDEDRIVLAFDVVPK